jgi:hypothetical protein
MIIRQLLNAFNFHLNIRLFFSYPFNSSYEDSTYTILKCVEISDKKAETIWDKRVSYHEEIGLKKIANYNSFNLHKSLCDYMLKSGRVKSGRVA